MYNVEAEKAIISLLLNHDVRNLVVNSLDSQDFHATTISKMANTRQLFDVIVKHTNVDISLLVAETKLPTAYIQKFYDYQADPASLDAHIILIKNASKLRGFNAIKASGDVDAKIEQTRVALDELSSHDLDDTEQHHISKVAERYLKRVEIERSIPLKERVVKTGITDLDKAIGGLYRGQVSVFAGRPGMGKTLLLSQCMTDLSERDQASAFFILETSDEQLFERFISKRSGIEIKEILELDPVFADKNKTKRYYAAIDHLSKGNIFIYGSKYRNYTLLKQALASLTKKHDIRLVTIDYIQLMYKTGVFTNRNLELGSIVEDLSEIASSAEFGYPHISLVAQLNRKVEERQSKIPMLSDLRDSGSVEQVAYTVVMLYRDEYYNGDSSERKGIIEFHIEKSRNGKMGIHVDALFDGATFSIKNLVHDYGMNMVNDEF